MTHSDRSGGQMVLAPASKPSLASSPTAHAAPPQRLLTTLAGWSALLLGLGRIFAPEARQPGRNPATEGCCSPCSPAARC
jgi:hypothetical protein